VPSTVLIRRHTPDGTTNFVHGFPYCCVSLGLIYQRRPILGVIYNPHLDLLVSSLLIHAFLVSELVQYTGIKGQGSYLQQGKTAQPRKLPLANPPKPLPSLSQALIGAKACGVALIFYSFSWLSG
jgi:myo-inositol-1(or 4)-monophosphatase